MQLIRHKLWLNSLATAYLISFVFSAFYLFNQTTHFIGEPLLNSTNICIAENFISSISEDLQKFSAERLDITEVKVQFLLTSFLSFNKDFVISIIEILFPYLDLPPPAV